MPKRNPGLALANAFSVKTLEVEFTARRNEVEVGPRRNEVAVRRRTLLKVERALLDPTGLTGRPWFKHLIYAPRPTYKPLVLPALSEAVEAGDLKQATAEAERLTRALIRAATVIEASLDAKRR